MNPDILKKLKDAGYTMKNEEVSLEEIIIACGDRFGYLAPIRSVEKFEDIIGWTAKDSKYPAPIGHFDGSTPFESVTNLWLSLNKRMRNEFRQEDKKLFMENYECWNCGKNHWNCLHHIMGRGGPNSNVEGSIYNAAPLNNEDCHLPIHGMLMKDFTRMKLLVKTKQYLDSIGYEPNQKDLNFLEKYKKLYGK